MREPLVQTQVLPYLRELDKGGHELHLLTFEPDMASKWDDAELEKRRAELGAEGITWHAMAYHKRPSVPATLYDIAAGAWRVRRLVKKHGFDILHCRVHHPMAMAALARKFSSAKPKLLFDIRGFFPEEYVDAGLWKPDGAVFRGVKRVEKWLMKEADGFVVLTEKAREILFPESKQTGFDKHGRPVEVIPCCVDMERFSIATPEMRERMRAELGLGERFVLAYVGAFGGWYLTDEMMSLYGAAKELRSDCFALVLTQSDPEMVKERLAEKGFGTADMLVKKVPAAEIPRYLCTADAALSFIKPSYSKKSSSPTKNAEYLACGVPIIANAGVGDVDELIAGEDIGVLLREFTSEAFNTAIEKALNLSPEKERLKKAAEKRFHLEKVGGSSYNKIYEKMGRK